MKNITPAPMTITSSIMCSKCTDQKCKNSKTIAVCSCDANIFIHEKCMEEEIKIAKKKNPSVVTQSQLPEYQRYNCPLCRQEILFRKDFQSARISCSESTSVEKCLISLPILAILICGGLLSYLVDLGIEDLGYIFTIFVSFILISGLIGFGYLLNTILKRKFYMRKGEILIANQLITK